MVEQENDLPAGDACLAECWSGTRNLPVVGISQRPKRHAPAHVELVLRMDVMSFADINSHDQAGVGCGLRGATVSVANVTPCIVSRFWFWVAVIGKLNDAEGEIPLSPTLSPGLDHGWQKDS